MTRFTVEEPDDYQIAADVDGQNVPFVYVQHKPCGHWIYESADGSRGLGLYGLFKAIDDHYCQAPRGPQNNILGGGDA